MTTTYLPTLSELAWINDSKKLLDRLLSYFFVSDFSQSLLYYNNITSLAKIIQENQDDISQTLTTIDTQLKNYLERYFKSATVETLEVEKELNNSSAKISLFVEVTDKNNKVYNFNKLIEYENTIIKKIIDINNG